MSVEINPLKERPDRKDIGQDWIPWATIHKDEMKTLGKYKNGWCRGAIIHFTAGARPGQGTIDYGRKMGYCFLLIDGLGRLHQAHPISRWGWHAGASAYPGLNGAVSDELIGIEIACAGKVEKVMVNGEVKYKAWFHKKESEYFGPDDVRFVEAKDNMIKGYYQRYTKEQEETLKHLILWLKDNDPSNTFSFDFVLGHDSVCSPKGRKTDPGGSLSMSIPEYQKYLKDLYKLTR
jgi:N-acetyl-anhydromuramyl-L-alanine amidase AmpD